MQVGGRSPHGKRAIRDVPCIHVQVKDGVVRLTGSAPTWEGNASRVYATRSVTGVRSIINGLCPLGPTADTR